MTRWFFLPACLDAFAAGALIVYLERERPEILKSLQEHLRIGLAMALLAMDTAYVMRMSCLTGVVGAGTESLECLFLFYVLLWVRTRKESWTIRLLRFRPLAFLGMISYSIYAFHPLVHLVFLHQLLPVLSAQGITGHWELIPLFLLVFAVSYVSWKFLEQPWLSHLCSTGFRHLFAEGSTYTQSLILRTRPALVPQGASIVAAAGILACIWTLQHPFQKDSPTLVDVPLEIQELQTELRSKEQDESSILSQEPTDGEIKPAEPAANPEEDSELTL